MVLSQMNDRASPWLYIRALGTLVVASFAIRTFSFAAAARWATRPSLTPAVIEIDLISLRYAIEALCRHLPWRTLCLEQGLTASRMLSRSGLPVTLVYGAAVIGGDLKAHVWV